MEWGNTGKALWNSLFTPFALKNGYLHLLDGASGKILTYSTADFSVPSSVVYLKEPSTINLDFSALTDSTFLFVDLKGKNRLKIIDAQGNVTDHLYPAFQIDTNNQFQKYYWRSFIDYHPKLQIAALATQHSNVIEIYHLKTKDKHIIAPDGIEVKMAYNEKNPSIAGYQDIKITDKYIYALYNGSSFEERMQESQKGHRLPDGGNRIHVFDLKGKPVVEYTLDRHLSGIYVDEESETIYSTDVNSADFFCCFKK